MNAEKKPGKLVLDVRKDKSDLVHYIITGVVNYSFEINESEEAILWYKTKDNHVDAIVVTHMCYFEEVW